VPAGLQLRPADRRHVRARGRPADRREVVGALVLLLLGHAGRAVVAGGGEDGVALGGGLLVDGVELRGLRRRGATERLLGHAEALREDRTRRVAVDGVADGLEEVREALHALGLGRRHGEQDDVRVRRHRVGPLDVSVASPARPAAALGPDLPLLVEWL
jgi:hypothetical protein